MKRQIALIGCAQLFSLRAQRALSAEFSQHDVKFFDTLNTARTYSDSASLIDHFEMVIIDAPTFLDLMRYEGFAGTMGEGARLAVAYDNDAVHDYLFDLHRKAILTHKISLLPMHATLETWLCVLGLLGNGVQFIPASAALKADRSANQTLASFKFEGGGTAQLPRLTKRESEVLRAIAQGKTNKQIANELEISEHTVKLHVHRLISKLGLKNRTEAAAAYFTNRESYL